MIVHHDGCAYEVHYTARSQSDIDVWLINSETNEEEELYSFPETVQDRAFDMAISHYFEKEGYEEE